MSWTGRRPRLAPHDAVVIEADAQLLYEEACAEEGVSGPPWALLSDGHKAIFRSVALAPYDQGLRP